MKQQKGITLIALIITIIILLILAGITINLTLGEHGIIKMVENAGKNYVNVAEQEKITLDELLEETDNIINGTGNNNNLEDIPKLPNVGVGGTEHTSKQIQYTWEELSQIAKVISDNYGTNTGKINNNTVEVEVSVNGKTGTLGIGDWTTVNGKRVQILGFNHDTLTNQAMYGSTNIYAGISFEYTEFITTDPMNNTNDSTGGWGMCYLRGSLNSSIYQNLENKEYIKEVNKQYIATYNNAGSVTTSKDKLWLLSCSEIWNNGTSGQPYGYAITKEGEQYKYYEDINAICTNENSNLVKNNGTNFWWLRSVSYNGNTGFLRCSCKWNMRW